jgi:hypothetical protein
MNSLHKEGGGGDDDDKSENMSVITQLFHVTQREIKKSYQLYFGHLNLNSAVLLSMCITLDIR